MINQIFIEKVNKLNSKNNEKAIQKFIKNQKYKVD